MMNKRILITGCAGFLGSNLIRYLSYINKNITISGIDRLRTVSDIHNVYMNKSFQFYLADINNENIIKKIFEIEKPEIVVHLASTMFDYYESLNSNIIGLNTISKLCLDYNSKLIYISTTQLYDKTNEKKTETSPLNPTDYYLVSKRCGEDLLNVLGKNGLKYNIIRATEVFGPRQHVGNLINMFLDIKGHDVIKLVSKGNCARDMIHVEDFSNAVSVIMENGKDNEIYNLSVNADFTDLEIAAMVIETMEAGKIEFVPEEIEHQYLEINCEKLKGLGWKPLKKFKARVKDSIMWYSNNQWFFK